MSVQTEPIGGASNEKGTQYEDITIIGESIDFCNHLSDSTGEVTSGSCVRSETIGGDCEDKQTQYDEYSYENPCNFILETIEEESDHVQHSEESRTAGFPEGAEVLRQNRGEGNPCLEFDEAELYDNLKCLGSDGFESGRLEIFETSAPNDFKDLPIEDAGCIIDKLDPIEELTEVDSLDSFSMHESEISREEEVIRESSRSEAAVVTESRSDEQIAEIPRDSVQTDISVQTDMDVENAVAVPPMAETRLPPEGAKMDSETNNPDAEDTHSVDSLEMIDSEKPPWKKESPTGSPVPQENNVCKNEIEEDEKNADTVSQSGSSVADSLDSDPTLVNGVRRSLSSTSDDGASTPKKESRLPIFIDKHPKFKGTNIPKPKTIRPQPGQSVQQAKKAHEAPASVKEHSNHDEKQEKAKLRRTASLSPVQRRKNSSAESKDNRKMSTSRSRMHSQDLGDKHPNEPRETLASRRRQEAIEKHADPREGGEDYLTPFQRKEQAIKELRQDLRDIQKVLAERESELQIFNTEKERDIELLTNEKDDVIKGLENKNERLQESFTELQSSHEEVLRLANDLELKLHGLKEEMTHREARHQEMYLEMYNKGKNSARFERLDELEKIAKDEPDKVTVDELLEKLKTTETELGYWQSLKRHDIYAESEKPETEAAATLRFLKDSMYHYITDPKDSDQHFRAMIRIFGYTPVQMRNIDKALLQDKKTKNIVTKSKPAERKSSK